MLAPLLGSMQLFAYFAGVIVVYTVIDLGVRKVMGRTK